MDFMDSNGGLVEVLVCLKREEAAYLRVRKLYTE